MLPAVLASYVAVPTRIARSSHISTVVAGRMSREISRRDSECGKFAHNHLLAKKSTTSWSTSSIIIYVRVTPLPWKLHTIQSRQRNKRREHYDSTLRCLLQSALRWSVVKGMRSLFQRSISVALIMSSSNSLMEAHWTTTTTPTTSTTTTTPLAAAEASHSDSAGDASAIPLLPEASGDPNIPSIKLGETIRFEEWGPIILNTDGTTRRIANWDNLTEREKKVTWRRISKRNEERRLALLEQMKEKQDEEQIEEKDL